MRKLLALLLITFAKANDETIASQVSCSRVGRGTWGDVVGEVNTCWTTQSVIVDSEEFTLASPKNDAIEALSLKKNKRIFYLPIRVYESFPNLLAYEALECSLTKLTKQNFKNLYKLKGLYLARQQIATIDSDSFQDLRALERLELADNKIKSLNGRAFAGLNKLTKVWLNRNGCIDEEFEGQIQLDTMMQVVNAKCTNCDEKFQVFVIQDEARTRQKAKEIEELLADVRKKNAEINEKIKQLQAKVGTLSSNQW